MLNDVDNDNNLDVDVVNNLNNICDNDYVGRKISGEKEENERKIFRVQGCNPNGFNLSKQGGDFQEYCNEMFNYQVDLSCTSEINLHSLNYKLKEILNNCATKTFDRKVRLNIATSSVKSTKFLQTRWYNDHDGWKLFRKSSR